MRAPGHDLARRAAALAALRGWEVLRTLDRTEQELRQLVAPRGARAPAVLLLRAPGEDATARAEAQIDALSGVRSEHVLSLIEVVPEHPRRREVKRVAPPPTLLLEHASGGLLAELLERRAYLRAGETATILMAVAAGLVALNQRGWSHGSLTSRSVVFRDDACPAIGSLSGALPLSPQSAQSDRRGFLRLAERLASSMTRADGDRMLEAIREPLRSGGWQEVADALAVVVEPEAVFVPGDDPSGVHAPSAAGTLSEASSPPGGDGLLGRRLRSGADQPPQREPASPATGVLASLLEGHPVAELVLRARRWLGARRRLVIAVAVPLGLAVAVLAAVPAQTPADASSASASPTTSSSVDGAGPVGAAGVEPTTTGAPTASASPTPGPASVAATEDATGAEAIHSDDPVAAAPALLSARHACFVTKGIGASCLDASTQPESALYREDTAALGRSGAASQRDFGDAAFALVQRWGDAALVTATRAEGAHAEGAHAESEPASILLVRSEAGWRLRDVYVD